MKELSPRTKACLEFALKSPEARNGTLTSKMLEQELINRFLYEPHETQKAAGKALSFLNKYCEKQKKPLLEPRIPHFYKLKLEYRI